MSIGKRNQDTETKIQQDPMAQRTNPKKHGCSSVTSICFNKRLVGFNQGCSVYDISRDICHCELKKSQRQKKRSDLKQSSSEFLQKYSLADLWGPAAVRGFDHHQNSKPSIANAMTAVSRVLACLLKDAILLRESKARTQAAPLGRRVWSFEPCTDSVRTKRDHKRTAQH